MTDYSMVETALSMGGVITRTIDLQTGELVETAINCYGEFGRSPEGSRTPSGMTGERRGLSTGHICTFIDGGLVKVARPQPENKIQVGGGKRGKISGFSRKSRLRLMRAIAKTRKSELPCFVTLTYPGEYSEDPKVWKKHLRAFTARLERKFPEISGMWKLEFQKRGAPHYHLLVWGVEWVKLLFFVPGAWYEVVGSGDIRHFKAGTQVSKVRSWRGVMAYASKYLGKLESVPSDEPGRFWGIFNADMIPWAEMRKIALTDREAVKLLRLLRRLMKLKGRDYKSLTAFADGTFFNERYKEMII